MSFKPRIIPAGMESDDEDDFDDYKRTLRENVKKTAANLKITIVPDIASNLTFDGVEFDIKLEADVENWFQILKQNWTTYKKGGIITNLLKQFYSLHPNPYLQGLKLYANCSESNTNKTTSLSYTIVEELYNFKVSNGLNSEPIIDDNLKMVAYNFAKNNSQQTFFKMIVSIFNLTSGKHLFVDKIRAEILTQHNYKDACNFAHELQLHEHFTIFDFLFPLVLQDKLSTAEAYLEVAVHLQRPFIELLDSLLDRSSSIQNVCETYVHEYDYKNVSWYKLQPKTLSKLIKRLAKIYKLLESDAMPNLKKIKNSGQLQFLLHKKYVEKSLNKDSWQEMVRDIVPKNSNIDLQLELIDGCVYNRDIDEAAYWARYFYIPIERLPLLVQDLFKKSTTDISESVKALSITNNWDIDQVENNLVESKTNDKSYYTLSMDKSPIFIVDKRFKFFQMLEKITAEYVIAFDAEWKPISYSTAGVALIQLATKNQIYLIDVISIDLVADDWNNLAHYVFNNVQILKIGYSPMADLRMFQRTMPSIVLTSQTLTSYLDLQAFWQSLSKIPNFRFPHQNCDELESGMSLSNLVRICFGKPLDKSNQFSNWENRPLRNEQISYAALDAYCLLEIYDVIRIQSEKINIDLNDLIQKFLINNIKKITSKKNNQTTQSNGNGNRQVQHNQRQLKYSSVQNQQ